MNNIKNRPVDFLAASFLIIFSILLGLNQVMVKLVNEGMHPVFQVALRSTFAIFPILIYCYILKKKIIINNGSLIPGIIAGILFAIEFIFLFTALDYSTVTRVSLIFYTMPVWLTLAAHFLIENDKLNLNKVLGLIIALAGLFLAVYEPTTGYDTSQLYQLVVSGIILLPLSMQLNDYVRNIDLDLILIFSFQVIVIMCMGFIGWLWIMSRYSASSTSSFAFLTPIFGVLFGWLIMDDPINEQIYLSLFFTCLGIYLINKRSSKLD